MTDKIFSLRIALTDKNHGNKTLVVTAFDADQTVSEYGHRKIDLTATLYETTETGNRLATRVFALGNTWCAVNSSTELDSDSAKELVLSTVAMKPGDTDEDYFAHYTPAQLAFAREYGELLSCIASDRFGEP